MSFFGKYQKLNFANMIHICIPYSEDQDFFSAICREFEKVQNNQDWVAIIDGDTMFLQSDFGTQLQDYVSKYPDTGLFTCYSSRCSYPYQVPEGVDQENASIVYHKLISDKVRDTYGLNVISLTTRISGHLMMIQKSTWESILPEVSRRVKQKGKKVLGVDTQISWAIIHSGRKIRLMQGIYIMHYFRLIEGRNNKQHLK